jgi:hypothetical protein
MHRITTFAFCTFMAALLLTSCVSTSLVYDPNVYHTGRTAGRGVWRPQVSAALGNKLSNADDQSGFGTRTDATALDLAFGVNGGITDDVDLGGTMHLGFANNSFSYALRFYGKYRLTPAGAQTAVAILPAISYVKGDKGTEDEFHRTATSDMTVLELHLPISYQWRRRVAFVMEPNLHFLMHRAHFSGDYGDPLVSRDVRLTDEWVCPGLALGMKIGPVFPEINFLLMDGNIRPSGGVAVGW